MAIKLMYYIYFNLMTAGNVAQKFLFGIIIIVVSILVLHKILLIPFVK